MQLTFKNLQQQTFKMDIEPEMTVKALKEHIAKEKGEDSYPVASQKLIYSGKILVDEDSIKKYNIEEKKFIVVMVTKAKQVQQKSAASVPAVNKDSKDSEVDKTPQAGDKSIDGAVEKKDVPEMKSDEKTDGQSVAAKEETKMDSSSKNEDQSAAPGVESGMVVGEQYDKMVQNIVDMGYEKSKAVAALKASFNNVERAIEYLVSGMPSMGEMEQSLPAVAPHTESAVTPSTPALFPSTTPGTHPTSPTSEAGGNDPLKFLRSQEMFTQMKTLLQRDPSMLPGVLQQLGQSNPQLLQLISQNQEAFIRMVNEPVGGAPTGGASQGNPAAPRGIQVSREEKEAIDRLKALGFAEHLVVQAYFACEKNEELAANFLLSQDFED